MARTEKGVCRDNKPEWQSWNNMRHRCRNEKHPFYPKYGERGITVSDEWYDSFQTFLDDMGKRPSLDHVLGRLDHSKGYHVGNCRWTTRSEQNLNMIRKPAPNQPRMEPITYRGVTKTMSEWASDKGISPTAMSHRLTTYGWTLDEALGDTPRTAARGYPKQYFIEWQGVRRHVSEWAAQAGMSSDCLLGRINRLGWTMDRAMTEPVRSYGRKRQSEKSPDSQ
ncbi:hypothetical protein F4U96_09205 [Sphingobium limneticum]|uniref:Uncharacterized protein n=2 Tax=Sphingobium limneticum TaxID=1007511 RepID=A0A5J5I8Z5_9SPHN|nr:hypothetical protein [Sphingobium limneticum]KAA9018278.1 hypothetical protein F4U96_09205 [Sphingobium limneticum]KAA9030914.1 hypothetical protein F4U95_09155 [Sphingobium limneticum]